MQVAMFVVQVISLVVITVTVVVYSLQLGTMRRATQAQEKAQMASLLMEIYEFMYELRPKWLRLYELSAKEPDWTKWAEEDRQIGEEVSTQLQRVAYLCEKGLIDLELIRDNWGIVFVKCWDILGGQITAYREKWKLYKEPYAPRPPRLDFESLAAKFREFYEQ